MESEIIFKDRYNFILGSFFEYFGKCLNPIGKRQGTFIHAS